MSHGARLVLHQARYDLLAFLRNRQARFFTLILPLIFMVIFVSVFGNDTIKETGVKASTYYVPGISALGVIAASFVNLVISITAMTISLVVMAVLLVLGRFAYGVRLPTSTIPGVLLTAVVGSATFCVLGYAISSAIGSEDAAQPMVQAIMLPLYFISGVFIPNVNLPGWLQDTAKVFPVQHLADGLHNAFDPATRGVGIVWGDLGVLALWAAAGLLIALRRFTWTPAAARA